MAKPCNYRLEQLANLGLPSQIFIPACLKELHYDISSVSNTFCWQNSQGDLDLVFDEVSPQKAVNKLTSLMQKTEDECYIKTIEWLSQLNEPFTSLDFNGNCPSYLSKAYRTILLPMGYVNSCFVPILDAETQCRLGVLIVNRKQGDAEFTEKERKHLKCIANIMAKGLSQASEQLENSVLVDGWEEGLFISNKQGELSYTCSMGEKLLSLASSSQYIQATNSDIGKLTVLDSLSPIINNVLFSKQNKLNSQETSLMIKNKWGQFYLSGFLIEGLAGVSEQQIGFNIRWQKPFTLKLFEQIKSLNLTPRQESISFLYAMGDKHKIIASKLNLSSHTVKEYVRNICDRLAIETRSELISLILSQKEKIKTS